jgi:hypothetical protein
MARFEDFDISEEYIKEINIHRKFMYRTELTISIRNTSVLRHFYGDME